MKITLDYFENRKNRTRYDSFWQSLNWKLPDSVLAEIWKIDRGNLHARRVRLGIGQPRWRVFRDQHDPVLGAALALEKLKARAFTGVKPAGPYSDVRRRAFVPVEISLELIKDDLDNVACFALQLRLLGTRGKDFRADINTDSNWTNPQLVTCDNPFGFLGSERDALALAAFKKMIRYLGAGELGGTVKWARWVESDFTAWLRSNLYKQSAERVIRILASHIPPDYSQSQFKSFSESLEG